MSDLDEKIIRQIEVNIIFTISVLDQLFFLNKQIKQNNSTTLAT
jgi:hypothetical protein